MEGAVVVGITHRVPTVGIIGVAKQGAHMMFVKDIKHKEDWQLLSP
jgi:hypothetical protein